MIDHHIQRSIIARLKSSDDLTFSNLKPADIDNKLFTYHLKGVIREGLVEKTSEGLYRLTSLGRKSWNRANSKEVAISERARSVIFLIIRNASGEWLLHRRTTHPLKDQVGFVHTFPQHDESIFVSARAATLSQTGLECLFRTVGSGFFRIYDGEALESFTNFTLLESTSLDGELRSQDSPTEYFWNPTPDFSATDMLPNMKQLTDAYLAGEFPFFIDDTVYL